MNDIIEVRCPKCHSNQLAANKKGFSGAKAVGGALLTGGIGLLAGTLGSNKVIITCLACGNKFKPGQGKVTTVPHEQNQSSFNSTLQTHATIITDTIDQRIVEISQQQSKLAAVKFCKDAKGWDLAKSKNYVDNLTSANGVAKKKEGCFIATACYGDYNTKEVLVLRKYRDNVLIPNTFGRLFVKFYYFISPTLAKAISNSDSAKSIIRNYILKYIVMKVGQTKKKK